MGKINLLSYKIKYWTNQDDNFHKWSVTQEHIFSPKISKFSYDWNEFSLMIKCFVKR